MSRRPAPAGLFRPRVARPVLVTGLLSLLAVLPVRGQETARALETGEPLAGTLEAGGADEYFLDLDAESWVLVRAEQASVDVVVTVLDPDGEEVGEFDRSARGPDVFHFEAENEGRYVLRVTPFEDGEGDYSLEVLRAEPVADDPEDRVDQLMAPWDLPGTPGVVVTVVEGGETRFARAYGMANLSHDLPFEVETPSNIGSVTKHFTAMALLLLEQDGELSLDDDVREHVPELPDFGTPVTLKHLLNHTGGYREIYNFLPFSGRQGEDLIRREEALRIVQRQPALQDEPGTAFNYNNTGYILLATVVERVSGKTFPEFVEERIFRPLGMEHSRVKYAQGEIVPRSAQGYVPDEDGGWLEARDLGGSAGAGGIYTTAEDMARWFANWESGVVGGAEAYRAITTSAILADGDTTGYGLGMGVRDLGERTLYTHTGGDVAHRTYFGYLPELRAGVWVSSNNATFPTGEGLEVLRAFYHDQLGEEEDTDEAAEEGAEVTWPEERLEAVAGEWIIESEGLRMTFEVEDGRLHAQPAGQARRAMVLTSDSTMSPQGVDDAELTWHFEADGSVDAGTLVQGRAMELTRVEEDPPTEEALAALEGRYYSEELELIVEVVVDRDADEPGLTFVLPTGHEIDLEAATATTFEGPFPYVTVEFQRMPSGSPAGFTAGNGRTKGVFFRRW